MKKIFACLTILVTFVLTGCVDYSDIHESCYATSIGVDYDLNTNEHILYLYLINNLNLTTNEQGAASAESLGYCIKASGETISIAMKKIRSNLNVRIDLAHLRTLILTERFFSQSRVEELIALLKNSYFFYMNFLVYIAGSPIEELFKVGNLSESSSYYTLLTYARKDIFDIETDFLDLATDTLIPAKTLSYPIISASADYLSTQEKDQDTKITTLGISGLSFIANSGQLTSYRFAQFPEATLSLDASDFEWKFPFGQAMVEEYDIEKYYYQGEFIIDVKTTINILHNPHFYNENQIIAIVKETFTQELTKIFETLRSDHIDLYDINYALYIRDLLSDDYNYTTITPQYQFTINIHTS